MNLFLPYLLLATIAGTWVWRKVRDAWTMINQDPL
jgi:hypothetical protein